MDFTKRNPDLRQVFHAGFIQEHSGTINQHTSQISEGEQPISLWWPFSTQSMTGKTTAETGNLTKAMALDGRASGQLKQFPATGARGAAAQTTIATTAAAAASSTGQWSNEDSFQEQSGTVNQHTSQISRGKQLISLGGDFLLSP